jgi:hypothetical protein
MKIYSNKGNFQALKILVAANIGNHSTDYIEVTHDGNYISKIEAGNLPLALACLAMYVSYVMYTNVRVDVYEYVDYIM